MMGYLRFNHERSSPDRRPGPFLTRMILFTLERGCGILPAVAGPPTSGGCCEAMDEMSLIDDLRCYGGMYLYRLGGGWLHDRSNLVLICYNHILSIRNSNKLESRIGKSDARSGKWNKKIGEKTHVGCIP
jgi:hypothetical protein